MAINPDMRLIPDIHKAEGKPTRDGFGLGMVALGKTNKNVVSLCCDLTDSTRAGWFKKEFPERFIQVGVAEQNMIGIAAGLAELGKIPFVSSYATFNPGRNWDQIRVSVCYANANVKIQGAHAGISVGPDGATHQALEDVATMRCLPNMKVIVPCDAIEAEKATIAAASIPGPVYLRYGREKVPVLTTKETPFTPGKAEVFREGKDVAVVACGIMVYEAMIAAEKLEKEGIDVMVINCHTIKPIDRKTLVEAAKKTKAVVTAEEHQIYGGLGSAVAEVLCAEYPVPMEFLGIEDRFGESGNPEELLKAFGISHEHLMESIKKVLVKKRK